MNTSIAQSSLMGTAGHIFDPATNTDTLRVALLAAGLFIVVLQSFILICTGIKCKTQSEDKYLLVGFSICDFCGGLMTTILSDFLAEPMSERNCRLIHICLPTVCCAFVFYFLASLVYMMFDLRDIEQDAKHNKGCYLVVLVFVAWFVSLVFCSLPVVSDTNMKHYDTCSPETLFNNAWQLYIIYETVIYLIPLLAVNALFVILALRLRKIDSDENSSVQNLKTEATSRPNSKTVAQQGPSHVNYGMKRSWETSVVAKWTNIINARENIDVTQEKLKRRMPPTAWGKRPSTKGKGNDNGRLWKKLQETVFSQDWRQMSIEDEPNDEIVAIPYSSKPDTRLQIKDRLDVQIPSERSSTVSRDNQETFSKEGHIKSIQHKLKTFLIVLVILNVTSIFRGCVVIGFLGQYATLQNEWLLLMSITLVAGLNVFVYATRWPQCRLCVMDLYHLCSPR